MSLSQETRYRWETLDWKRIQKKVFKLQRRIYRASQDGNVKLVHSLQRLMLKSWYGRLMAVRRVTQDNQGRRTAGIDGVKNLRSDQRFKLAGSLNRIPQARPLRRVWIPKPGKPEKRPLSIPVMSDRAAQALVKLALEPEWEAKLDANVYGFRPGRGCHDAITAIFCMIRRRPKYVLEGDIKGCFDNISHSALLDKINAPPFISRPLRAWLKSGVLEGDVLTPRESGAAQGGVISALLMLIALHGVERHLKSLGTSRNPIHTVFYADDFVVLANRLSDIERAKAAVEEWMGGMGLDLHPEKTKISHTLEGETGFDFLGFNIRHYRVGKYDSPRGYKTLIKPSKANQKRHMAKLKEIVDKHRGVPQCALIARLNPVIRGWSRYFSIGVSKATYSNLDTQLFWRLVRWANRRHSNLSSHESVGRYWLVNRGGGWVFQTKDGIKLRRHAETPIRRHTKVKAQRSPYDGDWTYWGMRLREYSGMSSQRSVLLKRQQGKCAVCELTFMPEDVVEVHHCDGNHHNSRPENLALLHRHCHDQVHAVTNVSSSYS